MVQSNDSSILTGINCGYKQNKARIGLSRVRQWEWASFVNPARDDGAEFSHWRRKQDRGVGYAFANFNKVSMHTRWISYYCIITVCRVSMYIIAHCEYLWLYNWKSYLLTVYIRNQVGTGLQTSHHLCIHLLSTIICRRLIFSPIQTRSIRSISSLSTMEWRNPVIR